MLKCCSALLTLRGPSLESQVDIPSNHYRPASTTVPFWIESSDQLEVYMTLPRWDSRYAHLTTQLSDIGRIGSLRLDASYLYHTSVGDNYLDRLRLDIHVSIPLAYKTVPDAFPGKECCLQSIRLDHPTFRDFPTELLRVIHTFPDWRKAGRPGWPWRPRRREVSA